MHLKYEDLIADPEEWILKLESFTGTENIDRSVMKVEVNTYKSDHKLEGKDNAYLESAKLNTEELKLINSFL